MTVYEHVMVGLNLALGAGLHQRYGRRIAAMAGVAAALPDWDGLSIVFGPRAHAHAHRVWGHNVLAACLLGALTGAVACRLSCSERLLRMSRRLLPRTAPAALPPLAKPTGPTWGTAAVWVVLGVVASLSHLLVDFFYSGHARTGVWPLQLLWPFSQRGWAFPVVPWGDLGATAIFIAEMFALYRWPARARGIAWLTLAAVTAYVGVWWARGGGCG